MKVFDWVVLYGSKRNNTTCYVRDFSETPLGVHKNKRCSLVFWIYILKNEMVWYKLVLVPFSELFEQTS
jgi:hypothetical protein